MVGHTTLALQHKEVLTGRLRYMCSVTNCIMQMALNVTTGSTVKPSIAHIHTQPAESSSTVYHWSCLATSLMEPLSGTLCNSKARLDPAT